MAEKRCSTCDATNPAENEFCSNCGSPEFDDETGEAPSKHGAIQEALKGLTGVDKLLARKEIKQLPDLLSENELPEALASGRYNNHIGIVVATNKRAIFIDKGILSLTVEDFPYDRISSIEYHIGMLMGSITIYVSGNKAEIGNVPKAQVRPFAEFLRARISAPAASESAPRESQGVEPDRVSQLERMVRFDSRAC
jgi:hypothetical protein